MSCVGLLKVTFTFLFLGCCGKPTDRICWFLKRTRTGEECQGPLRRFDEAIARFVNGDLNCWVCTRHWMRASREANEYCSSPFLEHSTQLSKRSIPKRFYYLFDRLGTNTPNYWPGIRWCNKCATIADNALSKESDYIPPKKQTKSTTSTSTRTHSPNNKQHDYFMVNFLDDYHNIHTKHVPVDLKKMKVAHMASSMVDIHSSIPAIKKNHVNPHRQITVTIRVEEKCCPGVYNLPNEEDLETLRKCQLLDEWEQDLKSLKNYKESIDYILSKYPNIQMYLQKNLLPFPAEWSGWYYPKKLNVNKCSGKYGSIIPEQGQFHVSLYAVEDTVVIFKHLINCSPICLGFFF